jgi:hypothetical protein
MEHSNLFESNFVFLCIRKRQPAYEAIIKGLPYHITFVDTLEELLRQCIKKPPLGLFIDILTSLRFGANNIMPIDNMGMIWPIMRCNITSNGSTLVLCMDTPQRDSLPNALQALINNDPLWHNAKNKRLDIRININFRARFRRENSEKWEICNGLNISKGGAFLHTYFPLQIGEHLELELKDLADTPIICNASVRWTRIWDNTTMLPGAGVMFHTDSSEFALAEILTNPKHLRNFLNSKPE